MDYRFSFTDTEWNQLLNTPQIAGFYISISSPSGMLGIVKEMMASTNQIVDAIKHTSGNNLVDEVAADIKLHIDQGVRIDSPVLTGSAEKREELCLQFFRDLSTLLTQKAPAEADGYKKWVYETALKSAEAANEGGFLGIGGEKVNTAELDALKNLALALGIFA